QGEQGELVTRPIDAGALRAPEAAETRQQQADRELDGVLGNAFERAARDDARCYDQDERGPRTRGGQPEPSLRAAERDHDEDDLEPLQQDALEGDGERVPVEPGVFFGSRSSRLLALPAKGLVLVVKRLVPTRAEDRLPQPLQPEREQQR